MKTKFDPLETASLEVAILKFLIRQEGQTNYWQVANNITGEYDNLCYALDCLTDMGIITTKTNKIGKKDAWTGKKRTHTTNYCELTAQARNMLDFLI